MGVDSMGKYYHNQPNEIKAYKNSQIVTKDMLLDRKFKQAKKGA